MRRSPRPVGLRQWTTSTTERAGYVPIIARRPRVDLLDGGAPGIDLGGAGGGVDHHQDGPMFDAASR